MSVCFGVYIGNTTCCIAVNKDGKVDVVANATGDRVTPAVVAFHEGEVVTGAAAKQGMLRHGASTVKGAMRLIGNSAQDDVAPVGAQCQPSWDNGHPIFNVKCGESVIRVSPDKVIGHIFQLLKGIASSYCNNGCDVTISLPVWASDATVYTVRNAAQKAGFNVLSTISQPAAASLAYNLLDDNQTNYTGLVFHCGESTSMVSIVEVGGGLLTIKYSSDTSTVAGRSLTEVLVQHFAKEFYMKYKGDPMENKRSKLKLFNAAENCKHVLSTMSTAQVHVDSLWEGVDLSTALSRSRFDGIVASTLCKILQPLKDALTKMNLDTSAISKVILSGGTCKIPKLQQMIKETFSDAEILSRMAGDEVLAFGAAIEAANMQASNTVYKGVESCMVPALSVPMFCKLSQSKESHCVFTQGTPTYSKQSIIFSLNEDPQDHSIIIYEATTPTHQPDDEQILAQLNFPNIEPKCEQLRMDFHLKSDGNVLVNVKNDDAKTFYSFIIETEGILSIT